MHGTPYYSGYTKAVSGSGKRQLADGSCLRLDTIGKLRRLRLPLPPGIHQISMAGVLPCYRLNAPKAQGFGDGGPKINWILPASWWGHPPRLCKRDLKGAGGEDSMKGRTRLGRAGMNRSGPTL